MYRNYSFPPLICQYKFMILFLFVISSKTNVLFCAILHKKRDSISEISLFLMIAQTIQISDFPNYGSIWIVF